MRALVVFESIFGNTEEIARAVAEGLSLHMPVHIVEVGDAPSSLGGDVDVLVAGGPTHAFSMTRRATREDAAKRLGGAATVKERGLREWLPAVNGSARVAAAVFDTRVKKRGLPGSAARAAERVLRGQGVRLVAPAESFYVADVVGPLLDGELERARRWGRALGDAVTAAAHGQRRSRNARAASSSSPSSAGEALRAP